jgi:hypothetical protein
VFYTLIRLWTFAHFTPPETRRKLVISLIVPQFLYGDVIFSKASAAIRGRLKLAFNACARYIYGISKYQHIMEHANNTLGCSLDVYYSLRICCTLYRLIGSGRPGYLFDELQCGRSARLFNLINPIVIELRLELGLIQYFTKQFCFLDFICSVSFLLKASIVAEFLMFDSNLLYSLIPL